MAAGKSSRINRQYKTKYRIRNWREYERGLRSRGDVTIWLSEDAIAAWIPPKNGLRGGQRRYSNLAIRTALTLRVVFGHPLRQTEGFLDSLLSLMSRDLKAPDHTTLSRRNQMVVVPPLTRAHDGPIDLIVDSTGLKILGRGEWNAHKHKTSKKRRDWRKLHIGVDAEGFMVAAELTASSRDDATVYQHNSCPPSGRPNSPRAAGTTPPHSLIFSPRSKFPSGVSRRTGPTTTDRSTIGPARPVQRTS